mmetsp:Transcript_2511/g.5832  ORF Transcript_2511/g.5832 Transcript_2511/m.5832 type:complete len:222 (-) Transcript_2511:1184-1849(-)
MRFAQPLVDCRKPLPFAGLRRCISGGRHAETTTHFRWRLMRNQTARLLHDMMMTMIVVRPSEGLSAASQEKSATSSSSGSTMARAAYASPGKGLRCQRLRKGACKRRWQRISPWFSQTAMPRRRQLQHQVPTWPWLRPKTWKTKIYWKMKMTTWTTKAWPGACCVVPLHPTVEGGRSSPAIFLATTGSSLGLQKLSQIPKLGRNCPRRSRRLATSLLQQGT